MLYDKCVLLALLTKYVRSRFYAQLRTKKLSNSKREKRKYGSKKNNQNRKIASKKLKSRCCCFHAGKPMCSARTPFCVLGAISRLKEQ